MSRRRRRNEVCNSLKQSSVIYSTYMIKNILELILQTVFIPFNLILNFDSEKNREPSHCLLEIAAVERIKLPAGELHFECEGKKVEFFLILVYIQIGIQVICYGCSIGSLFWFLRGRVVSDMLQKIEKMTPEETIFGKEKGQDFIFIFDLLAHTSGVESTLRVLSHADENFRRICQPRIQPLDGQYIQVITTVGYIDVTLRVRSSKGLWFYGYRR